MQGSRMIHKPRSLVNHIYLSYYYRPTVGREYNQRCIDTIAQEQVKITTSTSTVFVNMESDFYSDWVLMFFIASLIITRIDSSSNIFDGSPPQLVNHAAWSFGSFDYNPVIIAYLWPLGKPCDKNAPAVENLPLFNEELRYFHFEFSTMWPKHAFPYGICYYHQEANNPVPNRE